MTNYFFQKQPFRGVLIKRCFENIQQVYRKTPIPKCDFNKVAKQLRHGCSAVNLLHIFRTPFPKNTFEWLLLFFLSFSSLTLFKDKQHIFLLYYPFHLICIMKICIGMLLLGSILRVQNLIALNFDIILERLK